MSARHQCGWVVRHRVFIHNNKSVVSFWYGPERSWGTTFGPLIEPSTNSLSIAVALFCTRRDARSAIKAIGLKGVTIVPLSVALDELAPKAAAS